LQWINEWDTALAVRCNRACRLGGVCAGFRAASRLGDGLFWYALMLLLLIAYGPDAVDPVTRMALAGAAGVVIYKLLKAAISRPRPCQVYPVITAQAAPLDRFSFPSGHTLHAVSFSTLASAYFPELAPGLWTFVAIVAASRPVLGLHYPSDVLAGGLIGWLLAAVALAV
jgi:undecaprenyl-diphosphatase